jgi:hypothetical protein
VIYEYFNFILILLFNFEGGVELSAHPAAGRPRVGAHLANVSQMFHKCFTNVSQMFRKCFTNVSQMFHKCFTNVS